MIFFLLIFNWFWVPFFDVWGFSPEMVWVGLLVIVWVALR